MAAAPTGMAARKTVMPIVIALVFIAVPILELALIIKTGQFLGFWPTLAIVVGTGVIGTIVLRRQGTALLWRAAEDLKRGRPPLEPIADGAMLLVAGAFLVSPGLLTDLAGLLLLFPPIRALVRKFAINRFLASPNVSVDVFTTDTFEAGRPGPQSPEPGTRRPSSAGPTIDGEFERLDERTATPNRPPTRRP